MLWFRWLNFILLSNFNNRQLVYSYIFVIPCSSGIPLCDSWAQAPHIPIYFVCERWAYCQRGPKKISYSDIGSSERIIEGLIFLRLMKRRSVGVAPGDLIYAPHVRLDHRRKHIKPGTRVFLVVGENMSFHGFWIRYEAPWSTCHVTSPRIFIQKYMYVCTAHASAF